MKKKEPPIQRFNEFLAVKLTAAFGTMQMAFGFMIYGLLPLVKILAPYQATFLYWSNWIQLWSLPVLQLGQNISSRKTEKQIDSILRYVRGTHKEEMDEIAKLKDVIESNKQELELAKEQIKLERQEHKQLAKIIKELQAPEKGASFMPERG